MGFARSEVLGSNVDNVAADGLGGVQGQSEVLMDLEDTQLAEHCGLVDGAFIDRVWL